MIICSHGPRRGRYRLARASGSDSTGTDPGRYEDGARVATTMAAHGSNAAVTNRGAVRSSGPLTPPRAVFAILYSVFPARVLLPAAVALLVFLA